MLWTSPFVWLVLALPFLSAAVILHTPLQRLSSAHHRLMWSVGLFGLCAFLAGLAGVLSPTWTIMAVFGGGTVSGFACLWPTRPDDGGDDWRRWDAPPDDEKPRPPGLPDLPIDWQEFDRLRGQWEHRRRGRAVGAL